MEKVYGSPVRQDGLYKVGRTTYELIYGFGEDENGGWNWRKRFDHIPNEAEARACIEGVINATANERILSGFFWKGKPVWLSTENQINFAMAANLAWSDGGNLPVQFKIGEESGVPVYHTFTEVVEISDFVEQMASFINDTLKECWHEKDSVDYVELLIAK